MLHRQILTVILVLSATIMSPRLSAQTFCNGLVVTINGSASDDILYGTAGQDVIAGLGGNDTIYGYGGVDHICGGDGDDNIFGNQGDDKLFGGTGNDFIHGGRDNDEISGEDGEDNLNGGKGDDKLFGGAGIDTIEGFVGNDYILGNQENDILSGGDGNDFIHGGKDDDVIDGNDGDDKINGGLGDDRITGGYGKDSINGFHGDDYILGNHDDDELFGGSGNDFIHGGKNNDYIDGGTGDDELLGGRGDDSILGSAGNDKLSGNNDNDMIDGGIGNDSLDGGTHTIQDTCFSQSADSTAPINCELQYKDSQSRDLSDYELVFADEFNGSQLDATKWNTGFLWGPYFPINAEQQLYVDVLGINQGANHNPFELTGSSLIIRATPTSPSLLPPARPAENDPVWDNFSEYVYNGASPSSAGYNPDNVDYLSGIITSYDSFKMTHGYVETRAKLPKGQGLWPAFWLLNTHYVEDSPEIDVMEFIGQYEDIVHHTYHYVDQTNGWQGISTPTFETRGLDWTQTFHTFGMAWSPREIVWYVDGIETKKITDAEYDISGQAMYILANLAVGGTWPKAPDSTTPFPAEYEIDYIRAYKRKLSSALDLATDYQLMFSDEFSGTSLDSEKWNTAFLWGPYHTINNEEQYYIDSNGTDSNKSYSPFSVNNGNLTITADLSENSGPDVPPQSLPGPNSTIWSEHPEFQQGPYLSAPEYTSGMITSYDAFKFVNGYAEIRAKVPNGDGLWPAFWLLNAYYVGPLPEIDIVEIVGENPTAAHHTFHRSDTNGVPHKNEYTSNSASSPLGFSNSFHTYGVRWQPGKITWYLDGNPVHTYTEPAAGDNDAYQLMYVIANLAVGGNFNTQPVDPMNIPASLVIDYIRVYQETDITQ